jgi:hypothetical protein
VSTRKDKDGMQARERKLGPDLPPTPSRITEARHAKVSDGLSSPRRPPPCTPGLTEKEEGPTSRIRVYLAKNISINAMKERARMQLQSRRRST